MNIYDLYDQNYCTAPAVMNIYDPIDHHYCTALPS